MCPRSHWTKMTTVVVAVAVLVAVPARADKIWTKANPQAAPFERKDLKIQKIEGGNLVFKVITSDRQDTKPLTEIWQIENLVGMDHPFHLHGFRFQVLDRDGVAEPFRSWKDVVNVRRHETVRLIVRYEDFAGRWMYHCHILDHEDHGMMGILAVH